MARFSPGSRIGQVHGTFKPADAGSGAPRALTFAMYHPAAALHQGSLKETLFRDMAGVPAALLEARTGRIDDPAPAAPANPGGALEDKPGEPADALANPGESDPTAQLPLF
jgi:DNA polymerase